MANRGACDHKSLLAERDMGGTAVPAHCLRLHHLMRGHVCARPCAAALLPHTYVYTHTHLHAHIDIAARLAAGRAHQGAAKQPPAGCAPALRWGPRHAAAGRDASTATSPGSPAAFVSLENRVGLLLGGSCAACGTAEQEERDSAPVPPPCRLPQHPWSCLLAAPTLSGATSRGSIRPQPCGSRRLPFPAASRCAEVGFAVSGSSRSPPGGRPLPLRARSAAPAPLRPAAAALPSAARSQAIPLDPI